MADLAADTPALRRLGSDLSSVTKRMAATGRALDAHSSAVGSPAVQDALSGFEDHWERGRREIKERADALSQMLVESAQSYEQTDDTVGGGLSVVTSQERIGH